MGEFEVVITLVGVSLIAVAILVGICRLLGGWSFVKSWLTGSREETAVLTKSEHFNINGSTMNPEINYGFDDSTNYHSANLLMEENECQEGTTSFILRPEAKNINNSQVDVNTREIQQGSPSRRPKLERGESLSARLGKGPAPFPPQSQQNRSQEPVSSEQSYRSRPGKGFNRPGVGVDAPSPTPQRRSSWGRLHSQSSTDSEFPEFIAELESGENPKLKRAVSCDSVNSDTSVILEALDEPSVNGVLEIGIQYDSMANDLTIVIIQAHNLVSPDPTSATLDSYVQVFLLPDTATNLQTRVHRKTVNPVYKERFQFHLQVNEIQSKSILCRIFSSDKYKNAQIGQVEHNLADFDITKPTTIAVPIPDTDQRNFDLGEVMFSLSYLPTAERLTVVVVKARNLSWTHNKQIADPFIKVYLLQSGKKISKKKTSVKRNDKNPIFNEAMIFSVPASRLQTIQLRVTVSEYQPDGKAPSIGHIFVGTQTTGKALSHWNQMMSSLRKPVAMWHPLRK